MRWKEERKRRFLLPFTSVFYLFVLEFGFASSPFFLIIFRLLPPSRTGGRAGHSRSRTCSATFPCPAMRGGERGRVGVGCVCEEGLRSLSPRIVPHALRLGSPEGGSCLLYSSLGIEVLIVSKQCFMQDLYWFSFSCAEGATVGILV